MGGNPAIMIQTIANSQKIALVSIFLEDLVLTRAQIVFLPLSLLFKANVIYTIRALNKGALKANLIILIQTIANSQETTLVWRLKVLVGVAFKCSNS